MTDSFWRKAAFALVLAGVLQGCGGGGDSQSAAPASPRPLAVVPAPREITPSATDPRIVEDDAHLASLATDVPRAGKLFVFLPGTGGAPRHYTYVIRTAAAQGYHALGLAYVNDRSVGLQICAGTADPDCPEQVRLEILDGTDRSPLVDVDRANSIENRLIMLLRYLAANHPDEGWSRFLDDAGGLRWDLMAFAGHSQGAGHAAMAGKLHLVHRVALFSGTEPAAWTLQPLATPADRFYGLVHELEELYADIGASWQNLGLPGALTNVDGGAPPYGGSHRLQTRVAPAGTSLSEGLGYHNAVAVDYATPLGADGETPVLQPAWTRMIGP